MEFSSSEFFKSLFFNVAHALTARAVFDLRYQDFRSRTRKSAPIGSPRRGAGKKQALKMHDVVKPRHIRRAYYNCGLSRGHSALSAADVCARERSVPVASRKN